MRKKSRKQAASNSVIEDLIPPVPIKGSVIDVPMRVEGEKYMCEKEIPESVKQFLIEQSEKDSDKDKFPNPVDQETAIAKLQQKLDSFVHADCVRRTGNRTFDGMAIIVKYEPQAELAAEHDQIWFGEYQPDRLTDDERETMKKLGWFENQESWSRFC